MSSVSVKNYKDDERLYIDLQLTPTLSSASDTSADPISVKFSLNRLKNEELRLAIDRLRLNLSKKQSKKSKRKSKSNPATTKELDDCSEIPIEILHNGEVLELTVRNEKAWVDGAYLKVGEEKIPISYNLPGVNVEKLPSIIIEGCPLFPGVQAEFTTSDCCEFFWKTFDVNDLDKVKQQISREAVNLEGTTKSRSFTPQKDDVGKHVLLACIPKRDTISGKTVAVVSPSVVTEGPKHCPFENRQDHTRDHAEHGCFRALTYNLLADIYSQTEYAQEQLFDYCPPEALNMDYRKHLLLKEIVGYKADLLCFQEVDRHIFNSHLFPALSALRYTGLFKSKPGQSEGCASFIYNNKFRMIASQDIVLSEYVSSDPACADIWAEVCKVQPLREHTQDRSSILQVTIVENLEQPNHYVCLCNTHLYFHPLAGNVRLILAAAALRHIQSVCDAYQQEGKTTAMVFCGDFNSSPFSGVYQLMCSQMVPNDHADWLSGKSQLYSGVYQSMCSQMVPNDLADWLSGKSQLYSCLYQSMFSQMVPNDHADWLSGEKEQVLSTLELFQPKSIISACGVPPYTNFTAGFQGTLDYIFVDSDLLEVTKVVPLPSDEEVRANVAIPSSVFPSDHLALICDLRFS
ncbi:2',5'-phosphodiesterase 12 [Plakobranchus ocellatus]|uniref:2',5'-phosphodiesterase 12 n=1 Tax=Plakobranchus ocellatus TaxID=259542 RepID=A0AAV3Z175_9GAST|nr:2',5'-phosphodiesterase 12 [Plakobranchus ocellatus]